MTFEKNIQFATECYYDGDPSKLSKNPNQTVRTFSNTLQNNYDQSQFPQLTSTLFPPPSPVRTPPSGWLIDYVPFLSSLCWSMILSDKAGPSYVPFTQTFLSPHTRPPLGQFFLSVVFDVSCWGLCRRRHGTSDKSKVDSKSLGAAAMTVRCLVTQRAVRVKVRDLPPTFLSSLSLVSCIIFCLIVCKNCCQELTNPTRLHPVLSPLNQCNVLQWASLILGTRKRFDNLLRSTLVS